LRQPEKYISGLLEIHEYVIIPDFGGFVLNKTEAGFAENLHKLEPSGKKPSFNKNLNVNDGLMASNLAREEGIPYAEAVSEIKNVVEEWKTILNNNGQILLAGLGTLYSNAENKILFDPEENRNYLKASYGLPSIVLSPVEKQNAQKVFQLPAVNDGTEKNNGKIIRRAVAASAIAASILLAFVLIFNNMDNIKNSGLALFKGFGINSTRVTNNMQPIASSIGSIIDESTAKPVQKQIKESVSSPVANYYIVGGSFKIEANAARFVKELQEKGYKAQLLNNEDGWFRVSYLAEQDSLKADKDLHSIKINENQGAWLLKF